MRQPFFVTGIQVTDENMQEIASWCEGHVVGSGDRRFVRVPVDNPRAVKQTEARVGQWVLRSKNKGSYTYKVYTDASVQREFVQIPTDDDDGLVVPLSLTANHHVPVAQEPKVPSPLEYNQKRIA
jgi:hypothetical protein